MSSKAVAPLAVVLLLVSASAVLVPSSEADASTAYYDQLDSNGKALYEQIAGQADSTEDSLQISFTLVNKDLTAAGGDPDGYAKSMVTDVLWALYLSEPMLIWLWNLPVTTIEDPSTVKEGGYVVSLSITLTAPSEFSGKVSETMAALKDKLATYDGSDKDKISSINDRLRGMTFKDDDDGKISNIYNALVDGNTSTAGVAAAFTALSSHNGIKCITVKGQIITSLSGDTKTSYWNEICYESQWYAADSYSNDDVSKNVLLAGWTTTVTFGSSSERFEGSHKVDQILGSSLMAPTIQAKGVEWPDESSFVEKYGSYIFVGAMIVILIIAMLVAKREGLI